VAYTDHKNLANSLVATAPSPATTGTSLVVTTAEGALFSSGTFLCIVGPANTVLTPSNSEYVLATRSTDTFTIVRKQQGSSARTIVVGDQIAEVLTGEHLAEIERTTELKIAALNAASVDEGVLRGCAVSWVSGMTVKIASGKIRINGIHYQIPATTLAVAENGLTLPKGSGTLDVASCESFPGSPTTSQPLIVVSTNGDQVVKYTGKASDTRFNVNTGDGTGTLATGGLVSQGRTLANGDATLPRIDLIVADNTAQIVVVQGTAAAIPIMPALPADSVLLARIDVPWGATALTAALITDGRVLIPEFMNRSLYYVLDNTPAMKQVRRAFAEAFDRPVDFLWGPGDSIDEGYYVSDDCYRHIYITNRRLQGLFNPSGCPGGEGYIPAFHFKGGLATAAGTPSGSVNIPQRFSWSAGITLPETYLGIGLGQRGGYVALHGDSASIWVWGDRFWLLYTKGPSGGFMGVCTDGTVAVATGGTCLTTTGTGTITSTPAPSVGVSSAVVPGWPTTSFTLTVDNEDMTVTVGRDQTTMTVSARGINGTTAVAHVVGDWIAWAPAGVARVDTQSGTSISGNLYDSGQLSRGMHWVLILAIKRALPGITSNSVANPTSVLWAAAHGLVAGQQITIAGVTGGTPSINGLQTIFDVPDSTHTRLTGVNATVGGTGGSAVNGTSGYLAAFDGIMVFDGDGGKSSSTFDDGSASSATPTKWDSTRAAFTSADIGKSIAGTYIAPNTTITAVSAGQATLSVAHTAPGTPTTAIVFTLGGRGRGVRMWDCNRAGATSADFNATTLWADALKYVVDPDVCVLELGINDFVGTATDQIQLATNLTANIATIRARALSTPSIVLVVPYQPGNHTAEEWDAFVNAIYGVALVQGCAVWDMTLRLPASPATGGTDLYADPYHPTDILSKEMSQQFAVFFLNIPDMPGDGLGRTWGLGGDGSDGSLIFDGTTTLLGMAPSSSVYTLTRDIFLAEATINSGVTIKTNNFRIYCAGIFTNRGIVSNDGTVGGTAVTSTPGIAGAATALQTLAATLVGGAGGAVAGVGAAGSAAVAADGPILGGNGGTGATAGAAGGAGGNTANTANINSARTLWSALSGSAISAASTGKILFVKGGQGGGGGGGQAATNAGSGGGAGGGVVCLIVQTLVNHGTIRANGGNGGPAIGTAGAGGGGGGGAVFIVSAFFQKMGMIQVLGGSPGASGVGTPTAGAPGTVVAIRA
jgi:hypothetical protein